MDSGEVSYPLQSTTDYAGNGQSNTPFPVSYSRIIRERLPFHISIGMSVDEYMNGDPNLAVVYREANRIDEQRRNYLAWLQGRYIYDAVCCASPILHAFAKSGTQPIPYVEKPYPLTSEEQESDKLEKVKEAAANFALFVAAKNRELIKNGTYNRGTEPTDN